MARRLCGMSLRRWRQRWGNVGQSKAVPDIGVCVILDSTSLLDFVTSIPISYSQGSNSYRGSIRNQHKLSAGFLKAFFSA